MQATTHSHFLCVRSPLDRTRFTGPSPSVTALRHLCFDTSFLALPPPCHGGRANHSTPEHGCKQRTSYWLPSEVKPQAPGPRRRPPGWEPVAAAQPHAEGQVRSPRRRRSLEAHTEAARGGPAAAARLPWEERCLHRSAEPPAGRRLRARLLGAPRRQRPRPHLGSEKPLEIQSIP